MYLPFDFVNGASEVLIAAVIAVFTFAVTLLGKTIQISKDEEAKMELERSQTFQERISDLQNRLEEAKKKGNSKDLEQELAALRKERLSYDSKFKTIKGKYSSLNFNEAVLRPGLFFLLALLLGQLGKLIALNYIGIAVFVLSVACVFMGLWFFARTLNLIQEVSLCPTKEVPSVMEKLPEMIKEAFRAYGQEQKEQTSEKLKISFSNPEPFSCAVSEEYELKFRVSLAQGKVIRNVDVWFFLLDEFKLIKPSEAVSWMQEDDYKLPNKKTVKVPIGDMSIGPYTSSSIKFRAPSVPGKYPLYYRLYGEGYRDDRASIEIVVS